MKTAVNGNIHLLKYGIEQFKFEAHNMDPQKEVEITPVFTRNIRKIDDQSGVYRLSMSVRFETVEPDAEIPFDLHITIYGVFELIGMDESTEQKAMENNATAIIFPMLRTQLYMLMSMAELKPILLPVMNMPALFKEASEKAKEQ